MIKRTTISKSGAISFEHGAVELPADGRSSTELLFRVSDPTRNYIVLRLRGRGSFSAEGRQCIAHVPVADGEARVRVYAARRPGSTVLSSEGLSLRLRHRPASPLQMLAYDWLPTLGLSLALAIFLRSYAFASFFIPSPSMANTLQIGDRLIAEKVSYTLLNSPAQRGDIVLFHPPHNAEEVWIKRCIGLPGDTVEASGGVLLVNGEPLEEKYLAEVAKKDFEAVTVPANHYFVMGDNRNDSTDSRVWGPLPAENLIGRAVMVVWPPDHAHLLKNPLQQAAGKALQHHRKRNAR